LLLRRHLALLVLRLVLRLRRLRLDLGLFILRLELLGLRLHGGRVALLETVEPGAEDCQTDEEKNHFFRRNNCYTNQDAKIDSRRQIFTLVEISAIVVVVVVAVDIKAGAEGRDGAHGGKPEYDGKYLKRENSPHIVDGWYGSLGDEVVNNDD